MKGIFSGSSEKNLERESIRVLARADLPTRTRHKGGIWHVVSKKPNAKEKKKDAAREIEPANMGQLKKATVGGLCGNLIFPRNTVQMEGVESLPS